MKRAYAYLAARPALWLSLVVMVAAVAVCLVFPIYFRRDGADHLEWAYDHTNPLSAFVPSEELHGFFRPLKTLTWWVLFRLFGLNPFPYQMFVTLVYGFSFVAFFKLIELIYSRRVALFALLGYFVVFFHLGYVIFWISDLTFILEVFFINLSLYMIVRAARGRGSFVWGALAYACALMSKEPASLIVPTVAGLYLVSRWKDLGAQRRKRSAAFVGALLCVGAAWLVFAPGLHYSQHPFEVYRGFSLSLGISGMAAFLAERWSFYAGRLLSELGIVLWISALYLACESLLGRSDQPIARRFYIPLAASIAISLILRPFPGVALLVLLAALVALAIRRPKESFACLWFAIPLLGIMTLAVKSRTYLTEASFGIAVIVGIALEDIVANLAEERQRLPSKLVKGITIALVLVLCVGAAGLGTRVKAKFDALRVVSASRQNFRDVIDFMCCNLNEPETRVVVVDYTDMGQSEVRDILPLGDLEKAHRQKTMASNNIRRLLRVAGSTDISVHNLEWFCGAHEPKECLLFVMNNYEDRFAGEMHLEWEVVYRTERCGESACLYRLAKQADG